MLAVDLGLFLARSPVGDFGWGPPCTGVPERNGRATGDPARPGGRPGGRPLVTLAGPEKFLNFLAVHSGGKGSGGRSFARSRRGETSC
jgi:hypothetical protein